MRAEDGAMGCGERQARHHTPSSNAPASYSSPPKKAGAAASASSLSQTSVAASSGEVFRLSRSAGSRPTGIVRSVPPRAPYRRSRPCRRTRAARRRTCRRRWSGTWRRTPWQDQDQRYVSLVFGEGFERKREWVEYHQGPSPDLRQRQAAREGRPSRRERRTGPTDPPFRSRNVRRRRQDG